MANKTFYAKCPMMRNGKGMRFMKGGKAIAAAGSMLWIAALMVGLSLAADKSTKKTLKAKPEQFDAGTVAEGKKVEVTATIQNVGKRQVEITNIRTS
jgi:hypothetical protein